MPGHKNVKHNPQCTARKYETLSNRLLHKTTDQRISNCIWWANRTCKNTRVVYTFGSHKMRYICTTGFGLHRESVAQNNQSGCCYGWSTAVVLLSSSFARTTQQLEQFTSSPYCVWVGARLSRKLCGVFIQSLCHHCLLAHYKLILWNVQTHKQYTLTGNQPNGFLLTPGKFSYSVSTFRK